MDSLGQPEGFQLSALVKRIIHGKLEMSPQITHFWLDFMLSCIQLSLYAMLLNSYVE